MSDKLVKINTLEAVCFVLIITINRIILNMPQIILSKCGSSSILNVIYISIIALVVTLIVLKLYKHFKNSDILDVSEFVGGNLLKNIIGLILIAYFVLIASMVIRNFSEILYVTYYSRTHIMYLILFFILSMFACNLLGEKSIIKTNTIITLIMVFSLFVTFIAVLPNVEFERIFPIFGKGLNNTFLSGLSNIYSFNGLICIYCLMPLLQEKNDFNKIGILSTIITSILLLLTVSCLLLSLPFSSTVEGISPVYTLISNNKFGNFLSHPESLFVFTWILGIISYCNVVLLIIIRFMKKMTSIDNSKLFNIVISAIIFIIALIPKNLFDTHSIEQMLYQYVAFPLVFVILPLILLIAEIKYRKKHKNEIYEEKYIPDNKLDERK